MSGSKRVPLPEIREMLADGRVWCELAQVIQPDGGPHYYKDTSGGKSRVMVEVETIPGGMDLTCRLATRPTYYIPPVGALVAVLIPSGELDHCPLVVGVMDNGAADDEVGTDKTLVSSEVPYVVKAPAIKFGPEADQQLVQGNNQKTALDTLVDAIDTYAKAIKDIADPSGLATVALSAAILLFKNSSYLSSKAKTE